MTSLRSSEFKQRERADGGHFLVIASAEPEDDGVNVFFTDIAPAQRKPDSPMGRLLHVLPDRLTIWPLNVRVDRDDYLRPKYDTLERIVVARPVADPYLLPATTDDVMELLEQLPEGFAKDFRFGLGLLWEYRQICETAAGVNGISMLLVHKGNEAKINPPFKLQSEFTIPSEEEFKAAKEKFDREHVTLTAIPLTIGKQLTKLAEACSMDLSEPAFDLTREADETFAVLVDYFRYCRDCADAYSETQKFEVYDEMQSHIDALRTLGISLRYAERKMQMKWGSEPDSKPIQVNVLYVIGFPLGKEPEQFATPKSGGIRL